jgi:hypothetical protein
MVRYLPVMTAAFVISAARGLPEVAFSPSICSAMLVIPEKVSDPFNSGASS